MEADNKLISLRQLSKMIAETNNLNEKQTNKKLEEYLQINKLLTTIYKINGDKKSTYLKATKKGIELGFCNVEHYTKSGERRISVKLSNSTQKYLLEKVPEILKVEIVDMAGKKKNKLILLSGLIKHELQYDYSFDLTSSFNLISLMQYIFKKQKNELKVFNIKTSAKALHAPEKVIEEYCIILIKNGFLVKKRDKIQINEKYYAFDD